MQMRNAASVFPEPVGAEISVCLPPAMAGQPCAWASVGTRNLRSNHSRTIGWKIDRGSIIRKIYHRDSEIAEITLQNQPADLGCGGIGPIMV